MNRRDYIKTVAVGVATPYSVVSQSQRDSNLTEERYLTAVLDSYADETGCLLKSYEVHHQGQTRIQWALETVDGDTLFETEYPLSQITEEYYDDAVVLTYYSEPPDRRTRGRTYIDVWSDHVYHKHIRGRQEVVTYRENIHTNQYERVA